MSSALVSHLFPVILAGGVGSRLWPRSRKSTPKQFLDLTGDGRTMLQAACDRMAPLVPLDHIFVVTNVEYVDTVAAQLPGVPTTNIIGEPAARGSAAAIGLGAIHLQRRDPDAIMAVLTADHLIRKADILRQTLAGAAVLANDADRGRPLITLGIRPTHPETGYGYIEMGESLGQFGGIEAQHVAAFREKPDRATAEAFVAAGNYAWNSGMFVWRVDTIMNEFALHMPELHTALGHLAGQLGKANAAKAFAAHWLPLQGNITIDYGVMEKASHVAVFPVELGWDDIGSWAALLDVLPKDASGNVSQGLHIQHDSRNVLAYSRDRLIATLGLEDMIVVDTPDAVLVIPASRAQDVKKLLDQIKVQGLEGYLD